MQLAERVIYALIVIIISVGVLLAQTSPEFLENYYLAEDGILEWLTVSILLFCAYLCFQRLYILKPVRSAHFLLSLIIIGLGFIFCAGEELSWGQRIFSIETPDWLKEKNQQHEINVHNLMVGDVSINKVIFGKILSVSLAIYLFVLPFLCNRFSRLNNTVEGFGLPLPTRTQALAFLPALILPDLLISSGESDELREICGCLMIVIMFCFPKNAHIYSLNWKNQSTSINR